MKKFYFLLLILAVSFHNTMGTPDSLAFTVRSTDNQPSAIMWEASPNQAKLIVSPDSSYEISDGKKEILAFDKTEDQLLIPNNLHITKTLLANDPNYLQIIAGNTNQWKLIQFDNFQDIVEGWNNTAVSSCGTSSNKFLGIKIFHIS